MMLGKGPLGASMPICLAALATVLACAAPDVESAFVEGAPASIVDNPWLVSIQHDNGSGSSHFCGGAIHAPDLIVTAAHCLDGVQPSQLRIVAGVSQLDWAPYGQVRSVFDMRMHEDFEWLGYGYTADVGLILLDQPLDLSPSTVSALSFVGDSDEEALFEEADRDYTLQQILAMEDRDQAEALKGLDEGRTPLVVAGWGATDSSEGPTNRLQAGDVMVADEDYLTWLFSGASPYADDIVPVISASSDGDHVCNGDSGGPLVLELDDHSWRQVGLVSFGLVCGVDDDDLSELPYQHTRVSAYRQWVNDTAREMRNLRRIGNR